MLAPAHLSYPSLVFMGLAKVFNIEYSFSDLCVLMLFSVIPDLDYFFCIAKYKRSKLRESSACAFEHHRFPSHSPLFYSFMPVVLIWHPSLKLALVCFGLLSHFVMDSFFAGDGVRWLYPFSKKFLLVCGGQTRGKHGCYGLDWLKAYKQTVGYKLEFIGLFSLSVILIFVLIT